MTTARMRQMTPYMFLAPAAAIMFVGLLYPVGYMIYASFLDWNPSQRIGEADWVNFRNYFSLLQDESFRESTIVTLKFSSIVVSTEMIVGVGLALLLDRNIRGISVLRTIFILPMMIAPIVVGLMWRYMYHPSVGTFNRTLKDWGLEPIPWLSDSGWALTSIIIADIWQWTPFIFILALAALQSLPRSALEAARIDGASGWQQILHIKLPLMMPVLVVTLLLRLIDSFKVLEVILVMTNGGPGLSTEILSLRIARTASEFRELGVAAAMSNYLLLLLLALTIIMFVYNKVVEAREAAVREAAEEAYGMNTNYERQNPAFYALIAALVLMSIAPIYLMLSTSFRLNVDIMSETSSLLFFPTLQNYETVLCNVLWYEPAHLDYCDPTFGRALGSSLLVALISTGITLVVGCMAAYALVRFRFMGRGTMSMTTLMIRMVPPAVLLVPVFGIWTFQYQLDGTYAGIILVYVAMNLPFVIWILQSFIIQVPIQLEEAARMDGANALQVFFLVVLPVIKPGLAAASIFTFRIAWNEFLIANALLDRNTRTVPVTIVNSLTEYDIDWGVIMATGMLLAIPPIIFTFVASKQIITGMTAGAVKG